MTVNRYGDEVLARGRRAPPPVPDVVAAAGLVATDRSSGFTGTVVDADTGGVTLQDRRGRSRVFPYSAHAFLVDGRIVTLRRPEPAPARDAPARTTSGSVAATLDGARVARASRICVEGRHDAELVEKVWGDDLRAEGIPVEYLDGIDDLPAIVTAFAPGPRRRLGVLVDHLVPGSKETRIAAAVTGPFVLVTGHPYVDIWQGIRPRAVGIAAWPQVPKGQDWKHGVARALGTDDTALLWRRLLASVTSYADLATPLVGAVEQLIDFLTEPGAVADSDRGGAGN